MSDLARLPALLSAAALLIAGMVEAANEGLSAALFAAGFIMLGAWLVTEIRAHRRDKEDTDGTS